MNNKTTLLIIIAVIIVAAFAVYFFVFYKNNPSNSVPLAGATPTATPTATASPIANGEKVICADGPCLAANFAICKPAEIVISDPNSGTSVTVGVLGAENGKCHFQMSVAGHGLDCFFAQGNLTESVLAQVFGNEAGQAQVVTDSCVQF